MKDIWKQYSCLFALAPLLPNFFSGCRKKVPVFSVIWHLLRFLKTTPNLIRRVYKGGGGAMGATDTVAINKPVKLEELAGLE